MKDNKKNSGFWMVILCLALLVCIGCVGFIGFRLYENDKAEKQYEQLRQEVEETETESETDAKTTLEEIESKPFDGWNDGDAPTLPDDVRTELADNPIDFEKLQEINSEIYAWIEIPDTQIDYPVAQSTYDDSYYLSHNIYGEPEFAGCIYTEMANSLDFSDPVTVMYGHNMRNGSMFQNLHLFEDPEFFEENRYVYVYTPERRLTYEVFAAYSYDDVHLLNAFDFSDEEVFRQYLEDVLGGISMGQNTRKDVTVTTKDRILTLSTCMGGQTGARYLVQAVLRKNEKTK